jgi:hypothetical protein
LCLKCSKNIYTPDNKGGCEFKKICELGKNHCLKCKENDNLCQICEEGYLPDSSGGCSYTDTCEFSENGLCLKCKEDFILIGEDRDLKICKLKNSEDFQNCLKINVNTGFCEICEKNNYLTSIDKKCISTEECSISISGKCIKCNKGFYLNIKDNKCKEQKDILEHCIEIYNDINIYNCSICEEGYYFDQNKKCIEINHCLQKSKFYKNICNICESGYYISEYDKICTQEKNCYSGNKEFGICEKCKEKYYLDFKDFKCKSNQEENNFKYCKEAEGDKCKKCIVEYFLGR